MANLFDDTMTPAQVLATLDNLGQNLEGPNQQAVLIAFEGLKQYDELVALVRKMRKAQRWYFDEQTRERLIEAKDLEKKVDAMIKE